jgi:hypothetical protein
MQVPVLDLKAQYFAIKTEVESAIAEVMQSQLFITRPSSRLFSRSAKRWHPK